MMDISQIKSRINCVDYARRIGLPIGRSGDRCVSPLRDGATNGTSFVVYDDFWYDFGSGLGGDVIELCSYYAHNGNRGQAIRDLARQTGVAVDVSDGWLEYTHHMNAMTAYYHAALTDEDKNYLYSRGLTDDDINRLMIGRVTDTDLKGRLFLPYFSSSGDPYVCYYATRALPGGSYPESKYRKQKRDDHCQHIPWGMQTLNREGDTLVIAEGYFDAASFECCGYPVISAITGRFSKDQISTVISVAKKFKRVFIVYDNDTRTHAGEKFTETMAEILIQHRIPFVVGTVPTPYHDVSEYYAATRSVQAILDSAEDGLLYIASKIRDFESLETFVFKAARHTKRSIMDSLLAHLKRVSDYDPKRLESLFRAATTAPPETIVCDEILRDHQLVYIENYSFYEYNGSYWQRLSDGHIHGYCDRAYGEFSTYNRVKSLTGLLKTRALQDIQFNRQPVWNFINGTLELNTGVFRDHNPGDYCSFQAEYPYNPDATYRTWSKFIDDITMGDPKASEILQLFPGYVLMPHCKYEKIFGFSGTGGNGKSRYLEILRRLFKGDGTVTNLTPRAIVDKFQRIQLQDSFINIAGEIKSDITGAEELMKQIASGEPTSACYKGKDFVTFEPRSKLVFAMNEQLSSSDTSDGLPRRMILVDFKVSFVDNPDPSKPYERQKDVDILDKLSVELNSGGIFNWVYEGYKLLDAVGYFTETNDQVELLQDFKRSSNPVLQFYEDKILPDRPATLSNQQLYADYQRWCVENGHLAKSSNVFHSNFKKVCIDDYESHRTSRERGYRLKT